MNRMKRDLLCAFTVAELLVIMIISGAVFLSVMEGTALFRKFGAAIAGRIGRNSGFFADYCRLDDMVRHADSIRAVEKGACEIYYEGIICYRLVEKDSVLVAYADGFRDTMSVKISGLSVVSEKSGCSARYLSVILVTSKGDELPLFFKTEQDERNEVVVRTAEKESEYRMDAEEQQYDE